MLVHRPTTPSRPTTRSSLAARVEALEADRDRLRELAGHLAGAVEQLALLAGTRPALRLIRTDADPKARAL